MSYGFHAHPDFRIVGAADAQVGKPSQKVGSLSCNDTYERNMGLRPVEVDLSRVDPRRLADVLGLSGPVDVLSACPPCTGFSRARPDNHLVDDARNGLVPRVADFVSALRPRAVVMENARELISGNFGHHYAALRASLEGLGYTVTGETHLLNRFGLPQVRERALIIATAAGIQPHSVSDLWDGYAIDPAATTVRRAIGHLPALVEGAVDPADADHGAPRFRDAAARARTAAIPRDGGSWRDLLADPRLRVHLTPAMRRLAAIGKLGSHPDVYGRMHWDRPAPTIKRECGSVGNGRYTHPKRDGLLSVREMAILNGFPRDYRFGGPSVGNRYRHIGDAVPPLVSYQIAAAVSWSLTGVRPDVEALLMPGGHLRATDILEEAREPGRQAA